MGDYHAHTGHLEPMEDLAYRRLLDQYYLREGPLPADIQATAKLVRMRSMAADVEAVLREFFVLTDEGWVHTRCDEEIAKMQDKQAKAREAAQRSVESRKAAAERRLMEKEADVERPLSASTAGAQLPTPTPTPTPKEEGESPRKRVPPTPRPDDVAEQVWADWLALRRAKRAPVSDTTVAEARREADKAHLPLQRFLEIWVGRGSQGLQADWLKPHELVQPPPDPAWRAEQRQRTQQAAPGVAAGAPADQFFIDVEARNVAPRALG